MYIGSKILKSIHTWFNLNCSSTLGVWHWVDYTPATQVRRRLRASGRRELIEAYLKWNIDNLSDSSCSTIIPGSVTKTYLYNFDPLEPHLYIVKLGFTGVYIIFLISAQKHRLWVSLEPPRRGGSNEYPQSMFWAEIRKKLEFLSVKFQFLVVKFSIFLNRRVFVMVVYISVLRGRWTRPGIFLKWRGLIGRN